MTVTVQVPYTSTDANGVTTSFPFNFKCFDEEDLTITLDGVVQTTGFTVSGIGVETGGSVVFSVAPASGVKVLVANNTVPKRDTNYPQYGALPSDVVNKDFDRIWVAIQYLLQKIRTAIKLPFDTGVEAILTQDAAGRALKYLGFDAGGTLTLEDIPDLATTQAAQAAAEAAAATISGFENAGAWAIGTYYTKNNLVRDGGSTYIVLTDPGYTSGASAAADIGTGDIAVFAQKGDAPPGGGDVLVSNNLSEFTATASTARANLGLGTAATKATGTTTGTVPLIGTKSATEALAGLVELATQAEAEAGTDDTVVMTPLKTDQAIAAIAINVGTELSLSSAGVSFTGVSPTAKRITLVFNGASLSGTNEILVQLGVSGVAETTGYNSTGISINDASATGGASSTSGFVIRMNDASHAFSGVVELFKTSGNTWVSTHTGKKHTSLIVAGGGGKTLAGTLDSIFITRTGSNTFDAGTVNIFVEG